MKMLYTIAIVVAFTLSVFTQKSYAACTNQQKITMVKLDLSAEAMQKSCSDTRKQNSAGNINITNNNANSENPSTKNPFESSLPLKNHTFFLYTGLRVTHAKPAGHEIEYFSSDFSLPYFPSGISNHSFGFDLSIAPSSRNFSVGYA